MPETPNPIHDHFPWSKIREPRVNPVTLRGDYNCELTIEEQNEWSVYLRSTVAFKKYLLADALLHSIISEGPKLSHRHEAALDDRLEAFHLLYEVGRKWYQEVILPRREANKLPIDPNH